MSSRRHILPLVVAILGFLSLRPATADSVDDAVKYIDDFGQRAISALTAPNLSNEDLTSRFRSLFEEGFDVAFIAKSALGVFWKRATEEERAQYIPLFEDYIVEIYAGQFRQYSGESFKAKFSRAEADGTVTVISEVVQPDGPVTPLQWTLVLVDGTYKIRDIKIEGVSMINTYRDQFANEILQRDGKVAGLLDALRQKTASLRTPGNG